MITRLKDILYGAPITAIAGDMATEVNGIAFDSRHVREGNVFVAIKGAQYDGHIFIDKAVGRGAVAVVVESTPPLFEHDTTYVKVKSSAQALGIMAANFYDNPSEKMKVVGVTGTNGKTTVATLLYELYTRLGYKAGLISTICNRIHTETLPTTHTTPDALTIQELLARMVEAHCSHCFIEVSSHAAAQERIAGVKFTGAVFTNLSHDHLDYHKILAEYIKAKKKLFDNLSSNAFALVNADDKRSKTILQNTDAIKKMFSLKKMADFRARLVSSTLEGLEMVINDRHVWFKLIGAFNAYNLLAIYGTACLLGQDDEKTLRILSSLPGISGRIELIGEGSKFTAIVDYCHTPDALKNVLETLSGFKKNNGRIISVVGCGGNRDVLKRPLMAAVACRYSDKVIFTSDNPRNEDPMKIIADMKKGISARKRKETLVAPDREEAIKTACMIAEKEDIVLVAGKGHETYQEVRGIQHPFSDKEVLIRMIKIFSEPSDQ